VVRPNRAWARSHTGRSRASSAANAAAQASGASGGITAGSAGARQPGVSASPGGSSGKVLQDHRAVGPLQQKQRGQHHAALERRVTRLAERAAELCRAPQAARRAGLLHLRPHRTERHARDAAFLQHMGQRAHGARAERSDRAQQNRVEFAASSKPHQPRRDQV
jgi:hypothetical protein